MTGLIAAFVAGYWIRAVIAVVDTRHRDRQLSRMIGMAHDYAKQLLAAQRKALGKS